MICACLIMYVYIHMLVCVYIYMCVSTHVNISIGICEYNIGLYTHTHVLHVLCACYSISSSFFLQGSQSTFLVDHSLRVSRCEAQVGSNCEGLQPRLPRFVHTSFLDFDFSDADWDFLTVGMWLERLARISPDPHLSPCIPLSIN